MLPRVYPSITAKTLILSPIGTARYHKMWCVDINILANYAKARPKQRYPIDCSKIKILLVARMPLPPA
jgi:hypothetical protein